MNYFELVIAILVTICTGTMVVASIVNESPMKAMSITFSLIMFLSSVTGLCIVVKEIKKERRTV